MSRLRARRWPLTPRGVTIVLGLMWAAMVAVIVGEYAWQSHKQNRRHRPGTGSASGAYTDGGSRR